MVETRIQTLKEGRNRDRPVKVGSGGTKGDARAEREKERVYRSLFVGEQLRTMTCPLLEQLRNPHAALSLSLLRVIFHVGEGGLGIK